MNKTVNINLANTFFHIDEEAYTKLRRYLEAIKKSFSGTSSSEEIIADIEARIAELFGEKMEHDRQVITLKEVDAVITVMGQPEDYRVDEDIFGEESTPKSEAPSRVVKKLYRDTDQKYIGGVCAGLEHYLGLDALWIRLIVILLTIFTGFGIIAYLLLWILVPEAATTSQKLDMRGEPINISNIERKVKEGFDDVADKVKSVDYEKVGHKVRSGSRTFFDTIGEIFMFLFKVFGKFIGVLLIIIGAATLIALFIGLITVGVINIVHFPGIDLYDMVNTTGVPVWLVSFLVFLAVGIPFFFLMYLGLKILVGNLRSIGSIAKFSLLGIWIVAFGVLIALGIQQVAAQAYTGTVTNEEQFALKADSDTLQIAMTPIADALGEDAFSLNNLEVWYNDAGEPQLYSDEVRLSLKPSKDSLLRLQIRKDADGASYDEARQRASNIDYGFTFSEGRLLLNDFLTTEISQ
ncbi:MAG: PspC domain-containing protein [Bacteroidota bacterium]